MFSNAQEVNIFSSSNVDFYTILSHVFDSDSKIRKMIFTFFFFLNLTSSHHLKGYFSKFLSNTRGLRGCMPLEPPSVATKGETLCSKNFGCVGGTISFLAEAKNRRKCKERHS